MNNLIPIEFKSQRIMTTEQLAEVYETDTNNIKNNFNNHKSNFEDGKHYFLLQGEGLKEFKSQVNIIDLPINKFASSLYLWTERGANRHCKILDTDKAWEQFDNLEESYFNTNQKTIDTSQLSIETQLLLKLSQSIANNELEQKKLQQGIEEAKKQADETKAEVQAIRGVVALSTTQWRADTTTLINKMALTMGGYDHIKAIREESYKFLNERMGVDTMTRLTNKRRRMADEGVCKSKRDKLTVLDVIGEDKKLIEGYVAIIKEMSIKYGVA